jgi:hypothetical protein
MIRRRRYVVAFVSRRTRNDRRTYLVYAYNKAEADQEGYALIRAQEGESWREEWWPYGAERER